MKNYSITINAVLSETFLNVGCLTVDETDEVSIMDVAQMIVDAFQLEHGIVLDETKAIGQFRKTASNRKLRKYLPDFKFTPLREAINMTVEWFIQNYDTARK